PPRPRAAGAVPHHTRGLARCGDAAAHRRRQRRRCGGRAGRRLQPRARARTPRHIPDDAGAHVFGATAPRGAAARRGVRRLRLQPQAAGVPRPRRPRCALRRGAAVRGGAARARGRAARARPARRRGGAAGDRVRRGADGAAGAPLHCAFADGAAIHNVRTRAAHEDTVPCRPTL
ncbi:MAG: hypothetical protein J3K34DRAFT_518887, partial [Monoraphidium minutum]